MKTYPEDDFHDNLRRCLMGTLTWETSPRTILVAILPLTAIMIKKFLTR